MKNLEVKSDQCTYLHKNGKFFKIDDLYIQDIESYKVYYNDIPFTGTWIHFQNNKLNIKKDVLDGTDNGNYTSFYQSTEDDRVFVTGKKINGKKDGLWYIYYQNGQVRHEELFDHNTSTGYCKIFDENGNLIKEGRLILSLNFINSFVRHGEWKIYDNKENDKEYYLYGNIQSKESYDKSIVDSNKLKKDSDEGRFLEIETNDEFKKIINKFLKDNVTDIDVLIHIKKHSCYCDTDFFGEYEGYNYTVHGTTYGKWFETEFYWDDEASLPNLLDSVGEYEISELENGLNFSIIETDVSSIQGGEIEWSDGTPDEIKENCKEEFGDDDYDELIGYDEFEMFEYVFAEPNNNIYLVEISFKDSKKNTIKINWSNKEIN